MIRLSPTFGSLNFSFDLQGIEAFVRLFEQLRRYKSAECSGIPFLQKSGTEKPVTLILTIEDKNTLKITKTQVRISIEAEDTEDTIERFRAASLHPEALYPEWIQAINLSTGKNTYLYLSYDPSLAGSE